MRRAARRGAVLVRRYGGTDRGAIAALTDLLAWAADAGVDPDALVAAARRRVSELSREEELAAAGWGFNPEPRLGDPALWIPYLEETA